MVGAVVAVLALYLLFGPIEKLARKPSLIKNEFRGRGHNVPTWMKVFFRGLGIGLLVLAGLLLAPVFQGATDRTQRPGRPRAQCRPEGEVNRPESSGGSQALRELTPHPIARTA